MTCPNCNGLGMAWYWRTYGDQQYHGEYFEKCEMCDGKKVILSLRRDRQAAQSARLRQNQSAAPQRHADAEWAICPWCGYKHGDGWEWARQRTETRCDECDNVFTVDPESSVIYHTFVTGHEKP